MVAGCYFQNDHYFFL